MTPNESQAIIKTIATAYRHFDTSEAHLTLWTSMLAKGDYTQTKIALEKHIAAIPFPPAVAEVLVQANPSIAQTEVLMQERQQKIEANNNRLTMDDFPVPEAIKTAIKARKSQKGYQCASLEEEAARKALIDTQTKQIWQEGMRHDES